METEAQLAARRKKEQEDAQQRMLAQMSQGGIGGIFTWIMVGLVLLGGFMFAKSDTGKEMLGSLTNWLAEKFPGLASYFAPTELKEAAKDDPEAIGRLTAIAKEEGIALTDVAGTMNEQFAFRLLRDEAPLVQKLAAQNKGGEPSEMSAAVLKSVKSVLADPAKLATLLDASHRANTFAILEAASPIAFPAGRLSAFITKVGLTPDGKPTPVMNQLITGLTGDSIQQTQALLQLVQKVDQPTMKALLTGVDASQVADPALRSALVQAQQLSGNAATYGQVQQLAGAVAPDKLAGFMATLGDGKYGDSISLLARDGELRTAFAKLNAVTLPEPLRSGASFMKTATARELELVGRIETRFNAADRSFIDTISHTPSGISKEAAPMVNMVNQLLNPDTRRLFRDSKTSYDLAALLNERASHTKDPKARMFQRFMGTMHGTNPENLNLVLSFAEKIAQQPENQKNGARTQRVLLGIMGVAGGEPSLAKLLNPDELSAFMGNPVNRALIGSLLNRLDPAALDAPQREALTALRTHWGALADTLASGKDAAFLLTRMQSGQGTGEIPAKGTLSHLIATTLPDWLMPDSTLTPKVANNLDSLAEVAGALKHLSVGEAKAATPPSSTPRLPLSPLLRP